MTERMKVRGVDFSLSHPPFFSVVNWLSLILLSLSSHTCVEQATVEELNQK